MMLLSVLAGSHPGAALEGAAEIIGITVTGLLGDGGDGRITVGQGLLRHQQAALLFQSLERPAGQLADQVAGPVTAEVQVIAQIAQTGVAVQVSVEKTDNGLAASVRLLGLVSQLAAELFQPTAQGEQQGAGVVLLGTGPVQEVWCLAFSNPKGPGMDQTDQLAQV